MAGRLLADSGDVVARASNRVRQEASLLGLVLHPKLVPGTRQLGRCLLIGLDRLHRGAEQCQGEILAIMLALLEFSAQLGYLGGGGALGRLEFLDPALLVGQPFTEPLAALPVL